MLFAYAAIAIEFLVTITALALAWRHVWREEMKGM